MRFCFDAGKNEWLVKERNVTFEDVIEAISESGILADYDHPNQAKYPQQRIMVVSIREYAHCIPYTIDDDVIDMKTVYPSRKFQRLLKGDKNE